MEIHSQYRGNTLYITLQGEIDEHSAKISRIKADRLAERYSQSERAVFDLGGVSFMDSTGIGFLLGRYKTFRKFGVPSYIANPSLSTDKILMMSGVYTLMPRV